MQKDLGLSVTLIQHKNEHICLLTLASIAVEMSEGQHSLQYKMRSIAEVVLTPLKGVFQIMKMKSFFLPLTEITFSRAHVGIATKHSAK